MNVQELAANHKVIWVHMTNNGVRRNWISGVDGIHHLSTFFDNTQLSEQFIKSTKADKGLVVFDPQNTLGAPNWERWNVLASPDITEERVMSVYEFLSVITPTLLSRKFD